MGVSSPARGDGPRLLVLAGLPGTGKSTLARLLAERMSATWLRVDTVEAALLSAGIPRSFETGLAAYLVARDVAREHLLLGHDVIIDAVNGVEEARTMWRELAAECRAERCVIELRCADPVEHRRRVEARPSGTPPLPAPTWQEVVDREYLPWKEPPLALDALRPAGENADRVLAHLRDRARPGSR